MIDREIQQYVKGDIVTFVRKKNQVAMLESPDLLSGTGTVVAANYILGDQKTKYLYHVQLESGRIVKVRNSDMSDINVRIESLVDL